MQRCWLYNKFVPHGRQGGHLSARCSFLSASGAALATPKRSARALSRSATAFAAAAASGMGIGVLPLPLRSAAGAAADPRPLSGSASGLGAGLAALAPAVNVIGCAAGAQRVRQEVFTRSSGRVRSPGMRRIGLCLNACAYHTCA